MRSLRQDAERIWLAGVDAVRAEPLIRRCVEVQGDALVINGHRWSRREYDRVVVIGGGKAAAAMVTGLVGKLNDWLPVDGWVNVPEGTVPSAERVDGVHVHAARPAGMNEPTTAGVYGTEQILEYAATCGGKDLCIALISGGGSALLPAPIEGISLDDKLAVTRFLSGAGADITELNTVRKHLSRIKGGGLLRACNAGHLITLVLSDVLGDPLDLIASGPTVPDPSTAADALNVLAKYDPQRSLSSAIYNVLEADAVNQSDTQAVASTVLVIGNNAVSVDRSSVAATEFGYECHTEHATECEGVAEDVGKAIAQRVLDALASDSSKQCWITGGEPTVQLTPPDQRGKGGRNQQLVLAAYREILAADLTGDQWRRIVILSGGTDGEDGPTDAAGAVLDAEVHRRAVQQKLDVQHFLNRNDAYTFFDKSGGLITTGPTGTNVCDVRVTIVG